MSDGRRARPPEAGPRREGAPETCGPYLLLERIGSGGMAEVYRAARTGPEGFMRTFALKRIVPGFAASEDFVEMFCAEARVSALLNHPNIVQVHDFGVDAGTYYLVMEHLRGKTVLDLIRHLREEGGLMAPALAAYVARQVALGLAHAHGMRDERGAPLNLVHRDVAPSNVMLLRSGAVKLLDFGIVKAPTIAKRETEVGFMKGKFSYASPEQLRCQPLDGRSDVFSLGVLLWELLTLEKLFPGDTDFEIVQSAIKRPIPPPSSVRPDISPELDAAVLRALERDRVRRPDAKELAVALGACLRGEAFLDEALSSFLRTLWTGRSSQLVPMWPNAHAAAPAPAPPRGGPRRTDPVRLAAPETFGADFAPPAPEEKSATPAAFSPAPLAPAGAGRGLGLLIAAAGFAIALLALASFSSFGSLGTLRSLFTAPDGTGIASSATGATKEVLLELDSRPAGADVHIGGVHLGRTPLTLKLPRGGAPLRLRLERAGHQPVTYDFVPEQDAIAAVELKAVSVELEAASVEREAAPSR